MLVVTIAARFARVMGYNRPMRRRHDRAGAGTDARAHVRPTVGSRIVVSWAGKRGIVTLAAAFAIPER